MLPQITLILGGAASGKSGFAERLACEQSGARTYIATAEARDDEMAAKVARHQARRAEGWETIEAPGDLAGPLAQVPGGRVVLLDCATMWLANHDGKGDVAGLIRAMNTCAAPVIVVSNEVGQGIVPDNALARRFRQAHGEMNQHLAAAAGLAVLVVAGLPLVLKGELPKGVA
ncbi:MAG TPA: bifunctional adenosylcobinamide kinase/adenosylcobinamide-phosphate guanylyltransferase [Aliiroseovarius sp.]|nr:bifunctional adenosylcobinamide kinase/adenosylcobinamide-phosphate guanylyltransferase [Aliiroseovarius sp.]